MNKLDPIEFSQAQRLNRSAGKLSTDKSLFYLYLSMVDQDLSQQTRFVDRDSTDEIVFADIESHHYRRANINQQTSDFAHQIDYSTLVNQQDNAGLLLMKSMHPQGLAEYKPLNHIDETVIENTGYFRQRRYVDALNAEQVDDEALPQEPALDSTLLYDLIPKASQVI